MAISIIALLKILAAQFAGILVLYFASRRGVRDVFLSRIFPLVALSLLAQTFLPNVLMIYAAVAALMLYFGRATDHAAGVFLLLFATLPEFGYQIQIGSVPVILLNIKIVLALTAGALAFAGRGPARRFGSTVWLAIVVATIFDVVAHARGTTGTNVVRESVQTLVALIIPLLAMTTLAFRARDLRVFIAYVAATCMCLTVIVVFEAVSGWNFYRTIYAHVGLPPVWDQLRWRNGLVRASGPVFEATTMGVILAMLTLFTWSSRGLFRSTIARYAVTAVNVLGVYVTQSRNPLFGLAIGVVVGYLLRSAKGKSAAQAVTLSVAVMGAAIVGIVNLDTGPKPSANQVESTLDYRIRLLNRGVEQFWLNPVIGASRIDVDHGLEDLRQGEGIIDYVNSYLYIALLSGAVGLLVALGTLLKVLYDLTATYVRRRHADSLNGIYGLAVVTAAFIFMSYFTWVFGLILPVYLLLLVTFARMRHRWPVPAAARPAMDARPLSLAVRPSVLAPAGGVARAGPTSDHGR